MIVEQAQSEISPATPDIVTEVHIAVSDIERSLDECLVLAVELRKCAQAPADEDDPERNAIDWPALLH